MRQRGFNQILPTQLAGLTMRVLSHTGRGESMSTENFKAQAARLVKYLSEHHKFRLRQSSSLEAIAAIHGVRNWNTLINRPPSPASQTEASSAIQDSAPNGALRAPAPSQGVSPDESNAWPGFEEHVPVPPVLTPSTVDALVADRMERLVYNVTPFLKDSTHFPQRCGWRKGNRLYLLEIRFREFIFAHFADSAQSSLRETPRHGLHSVTQAFLRALNARGWLVTEEGGQEVATVEKALWNLKIGTLPWKGVIVLEMPTSMSHSVELPDTRHEVSFEGPLFPREPAPVESV